MQVLEITKEDQELIEEAKKIIQLRYNAYRHNVGASVRTKSGKIFAAVNIQAYLRKMDICAEAIALGIAVTQGENQFDTIVAVRHPYAYEENKEIKVISPCGACRELIYDYGSKIKVIILNNSKLEKYTIADLLPLKYKRR